MPPGPMATSDSCNLYSNLAIVVVSPALLCYWISMIDPLLRAVYDLPFKISERPISFVPSGSSVIFDLV